MSSGHVPRQSGSQRRYRSLALTYVTFSPDGNELLANVGGEQIYLFDVTSARQPLKLQVPAKARPTSSNGFCSNGLHVRNGTTNGVTEALSQTLRTEDKKSKSRRPKLVFFFIFYVMPPSFVLSAILPLPVSDFRRTSRLLSVAPTNCLHPRVTLQLSPSTMKHCNSFLTALCSLATERQH